jgi:hypothetical protein
MSSWRRLLDQIIKTIRTDLLIDFWIAFQTFQIQRLESNRLIDFKPNRLIDSKILVQKI